MSIICCIFAAAIVPNNILKVSLMISYKIVVLDNHQRELYRNTVEVSNGVVFPFDDVCRVLKLLYPKSSCVQISIFTL